MVTLGLRTVTKDELPERGLLFAKSQPQTAS